MLTPDWISCIPWPSWTKGVVRDTTRDTGVTGGYLVYDEDPTLSLRPSPTCAVTVSRLSTIIHSLAEGQGKVQGFYIFQPIRRKLIAGLVSDWAARSLWHGDDTHVMDFITTQTLTLHFVTTHTLILPFITTHTLTLNFITTHTPTLYFVTTHTSTLHFVATQKSKLRFVTTHFLILHFVTILTLNCS